jgi:RNA polymerase subunit RPABC4/transcription elongation factor Spt4
MPERPPAPAECANCGATIPRNARACPACGADERTGWRETSIYDDLDLPESAWSDETAPQPAASAPRVNGVRWYWWCVGAVLVALLVAGVIGFR